MVRRFFACIFYFVMLMLTKVKNALFLPKFYKGLNTLKMDIYKCPFSKKILKIFFKKKTHLKV